MQEANRARDRAELKSELLQLGAGGGSGRDNTFRGRPRYRGPYGPMKRPRTTDWLTDSDDGSKENRDPGLHDFNKSPSHFPSSRRLPSRRGYRSPGPSGRHYAPATPPYAGRLLSNSPQDSPAHGETFTPTNLMPPSDSNNTDASKQSFEV